MLWPSEIAQHGMLSFNLNQFLLSELGFPLLKIQRCHGIFILSLEFASCPVRITSKIPTYLLTYLLTCHRTRFWFLIYSASISWSSPHAEWHVTWTSAAPWLHCVFMGMWHEPELHPDFIVFSWRVSLWCDHRGWQDTISGTNQSVFQLHRNEIQNYF